MGLSAPRQETATSWIWDTRVEANEADLQILSLTHKHITAALIHAPPQKKSNGQTL